MLVEPWALNAWMPRIRTGPGMQPAVTCSQTLLLAACTPACVLFPRVASHPVGVGGPFSAARPRSVLFPPDAIFMPQASQQGPWPLPAEGRTQAGQAVSRAEPPSTQAVCVSAPGRPASPPDPCPAPRSRARLLSPPGASGAPSCSELLQHLLPAHVARASAVILPAPQESGSRARPGAAPPPHPDLTCRPLQTHPAAFSAR